MSRASGLRPSCVGLQASTIRPSVSRTASSPVLECGIDVDRAGDQVRPSRSIRWCRWRPRPASSAATSSRGRRVFRDSRLDDPVVLLGHEKLSGRRVPRRGPHQTRIGRGRREGRPVLVATVVTARARPARPIDGAWSPMPLSNTAGRLDLDPRRPVTPRSRPRHRRGCRRC